MFISKEEKDKIKVRLFNLECTTALSNTIDCETCGCMIKKDLAVKGESVVKKENLITATAFCALSNGTFKYEPNEYIHTPYYCKRCVPVKKGKK